MTLSTPAQLSPLILAMADIFDRLKLQHAFGGALANNYWGVVRATQDIDLLVLLPSLRFQELATVLGDAGFTMRTVDDAPAPVDVPRMVEEVRDRRLFAVYRQGIKIEIFLPFLPLQNEILRRAVKLPFEGRPISVTTAEDLILLKMAFHRDKDLGDIRGILAVQKGKLDLNYLRRWTPQMMNGIRAEELEVWIRDYGD